MIYRFAWYWVYFGPDVPALGPYTTLAQATYIAAHLGYWPVAGKA